MDPPAYLREQIPKFYHDEVASLTTDYWGSLERERAIMGGSLTPALGLAPELFHQKF